MAASDPHFWATVFGILGNIVSFFVFLSPIPTFYRIFKKKSTEGFQAIPYSVALFSAMLLLYYAYLKEVAKEGGVTLLVTINSIGCAIETTYLVIFMIYAPTKTRVYTSKLLLVFNVVAYGAILIGTYFITNNKTRLTVVGWANVVFSVSVFAAPLSIMRLVIRTRSVEFMSFPLSFSLTICAAMWFLYGFLLGDLYIASPNVLGFAFGIAQMILYMVFKNSKKQGILPQFSVDKVMLDNMVAENKDIQLKTENNDKVMPDNMVAENNDTQLNAENNDTQLKLEGTNCMTSDQSKVDNAIKEKEEVVVCVII